MKSSAGAIDHRPGCASADQGSSVNAAISREVDSWFRRQCALPGMRFYLYYRKARNEELVGDLQIAADSPGNNWHKATEEPMSCAWTRERASAFVQQHANGLPLFNPAFGLLQ